MLIRKKISPKPIHGKCNSDVVQPIRCTDTGEILVQQVNPPDLEEIEQCLQGLRSDLSGTITVRNDRPVDVVLDKIKVDGTVTVEPVTVTNMPSEIKIQEHLHIVQTPVAAKVAPFSFRGYGTVILSKPCRIYSVYLTVYEPTYIEVVGITGEIHTGEFKMDLFPLFIHLDKVEIKTSEYVNAGGYILYENC
jgi:hypothetical protein